MRQMPQRMRRQQLSRFMLAQQCEKMDTQGSQTFGVNKLSLSPRKARSASTKLHNLAAGLRFHPQGRQTSPLISQHI